MKEKGSLGYMNAYKKRQGRYIAGLALVILAAVAAVFLIFGTLRHVAILIPVILALPFAKLSVLWLIVAKYHSLDETEGKQVQERLGKRKNCIVLFDMALSSYETISYVPCLVIDQGNLYLLWGGSNDKHYKEEQLKEYVQGIIDRTGYSEFHAFICSTLPELMETVEAAPEAEGDLATPCQRLQQRLLDICV